MRKKDWKKRVASAVLTGAMVVSQIGVWNAGVGLEVVKAEDVYYITNGDFSENVEGWTVTTDLNGTTSDSLTFGSDVGRTGKGAYISNSGTANSDAYFTQKIATLPAGKYTLTAYAMGNGYDGANAVVNGEKINDTWTTSPKWVDDASKWSKIEYTFEVSEDITNCVIGLYLWTYQGGEWSYIDDISLTRIEEIKYITNGDFSENVEGWTLTTDLNGTTSDSLTFGSDAGRTGKGAYISNSGTANSDAYFTQKIATLPAGKYTLTAYAMGNGYDGANVVVNGEKINDTWTTSPKWVDDASKWSKIEYTFEVSEDITNCVVGLYLWTYQGGEWSYIDDISLTKVEPSSFIYEDLQNLIDKVPANYENAGFTTDSKEALKTALASANAITAESSDEELESAYKALESALTALVYEDSTINVSKIEGLNDKTDFIKGVDISSYVTEVNSGVKYYDWNGNEITSGKDFVKLFAETGVNYIRIRVWNDPKDADGHYYGGGNNDLEMAKTICGYIKEYNDAYKNTLGEVKVLVDLQYSDFWADPEKQAAPKAWKDMTIEDKVSNVKTYTTSCLSAIEATGVTVGMVQIGNETNTGICGTAYGTQDYLKIFTAGCDAVKEYNNEKGYTIENGKWIKRVVHFTDPQNASTTFAKCLKDGGVEYDVYATSYYPFWHGTTENLQKMLSAIAKSCNCEVMVAETQYVYTNEDYDGADNQAYEGKNNIDLSQWPVSVQGQANEIHDVMYAAANATNGIGMFYWEPAWLGVGNAYNEDGTINETKLSQNKDKWEQYGSGWATEAAREYDPSAAKWGGGGTNNENASLFDFTGHPLASLNVFKYVNYGAVATTKTFYRAEPLDGIVVKMGTSATGIKNALATTTNYLYNDGTTGTADITWASASLTEVAKTISSTSAIGNYYMVEGSINVDGAEHKVTCEILVDPKENLLTNGGFEDSINEEWTFANKNLLWRAATEGAEYNKDANTRNGSTGSVILNSYFGNFEEEEIPQADNNGCYFDSISQTVENLPAGIYEAKGFFEGAYEAGSQTGEKINISVTDGAGVTRVSNSVVLDDWMVWQSATVSNIVITDAMVAAGQNSITVSANVCIQKDVWGSIDDVYLYKVGEYTAPSGGGSVVTPSEPSTDNTTVTTNPDGTTTETKTETVTNEAGKEVEVTTEAKKDAEGNVIGSTEISVIESIAKNTTATVTVEKNASGEVTSAKAEVTKQGTSSKTGVTGTISAAVVSQITDAAGVSSVEISVNVTNVKGEIEYTIKADAEDLEAGNKLKVMAIDPKTGKYVLVNAKTYTVSKSGNVKVTLPEGATYQLLDSKEAAAVEKEILSTVKVKKTSITVKTGKKTSVQMSSKLDMDNVEKITYSTSKKSVATVSKSGKVTAKNAGTVTIKAKVTLKNGKTKTVTVKVKVK